jgi:hypothetical protein
MPGFGWSERVYFPIGFDIALAETILLKPLMSADGR